jgi:hypothetical protein
MQIISLEDSGVLADFRDGNCRAQVPASLACIRWAALLSALKNKQKLDPTNN